MKRVTTVLAALCLCFVLSLNAAADVIYEPEDSFFKKHRDECYYENRTYIASGEGGYAAVHKNPTSGKTTMELPNGNEYWVSFIWDQDGGWGLLQGRGWVRMEEMTVKYDGISFREEFGSEFISPEGGERFSLQDYGSMMLWRFPGDAAPFGEIDWTRDETWRQDPPEGLVSYRQEEPLEDQLFYTVYTDPLGRRWGFLGYLYGSRDFWVCLTYPEAWELPIPGMEEKYVSAAAPAPENEPTSAPTAAPTTAPSAAPDAGPDPTMPPPIVDPEPPRPFPWLPLGLAGGAAVVALGLLAVFRRRK